LAPAGAVPGRFSLSLPRLSLADGTLEALKWLALVLMTLDHVNKYLLADSQPMLFAAGRLAAPLFAAVLGYNLARPGLTAGAHGRICRRLAICGAIASVPFVALGGLGWGWWPLNIAFTLLVATAAAQLLELGGRRHALLAIALVLVGGSSVEFWWPAIGIVLCVRAYSRRPGWLALLGWVGCTALLQLINGNAWALASLPLIVLARQVDIALPKLRTVFYVYYPAHLTVLWLLKHL